MAIEEKIAASKTHIFKTVFPNTTNHYDTLFGGTALHLMDEVAFITASRQRVVTVSSGQIDFKQPTPAGTLPMLEIPAYNPFARTSISPCRPLFYYHRNVTFPFS